MPFQILFLIAFVNDKPDRRTEKSRNLNSIPVWLGNYNIIEYNFNTIVAF